MLYNIFRLNVGGSKCELLSSGMFLSYVQGMVVLYKHMEINRTDRKIRAFAKAVALAIDGDVHVFIPNQDDSNNPRIVCGQVFNDGLRSQQDYARI